MALSDPKIKNAKPRDKSYKLSDKDGLYLLITPKGSKYWRYKYRFNGKEKLLALGVYDETSLAGAREKLHEARSSLAKKIDPGLAKQKKKQTDKLLAQNSFELIARDWFSKFSVKWTEKHAARTLHMLEQELFPWIGVIKLLPKYLHLRY